MLKKEINELWEKREDIKHIKHNKEYILSSIKALNSGKVRMISKIGDNITCNEWLKKAILLYFLISETSVMEENAYDKIPLKCKNWTKEDFKRANFRMVPGAIVRYGSFIEEKVVLMPCFVNIGSYVGEKTMIDTFATVGSCAQIGKNCHISGGVGIGGVIEPINNTPVVIEDNVFIGGRTQIAEGSIVKEGAVLSMGLNIGQSTKIYDQEEDKLYYGFVPKYSVVIPGSIKNKYGIHQNAAIIIKKNSPELRKKLSINKILRT